MWKLDCIAVTYDKSYYSEKKDIYYIDTVTLSPQLAQLAYTLYLDSAKEIRYSYFYEGYGYWDRFTLYTSSSRAFGLYWLTDERHCLFDVFDVKGETPSHPLDQILITSFPVIDSYKLNTTQDTLIMTGFIFDRSKQDWYDYVFEFHKL